ncbi:MAG: penicillin-binding protein 1A, partial [Gemmatimonadota bacterium]
MAVPGARRLRRWWHTPRVRNRVLIGVLAVLAFGAALLAGAWTRACVNEACPSIAGLTNYDPQQASKVYAADGRLITDLGEQRRTVVPLREMSPAVIAAFLATEDKRFYQHHGVDWLRFFGAIKANVLKGRVVQGFSTITMQLAGNLWPEDINRRDRSLSRKIREARVAMEIERHYSKDRILELYLNQINLGNRAYGVEAASQRYFGKSVKDLNVAEAAMLAALPKAPERYNPRRNPDLAVMRRNVVIGLLRDEGAITAEEAEKWKAYPLLLSSRSDYTGVADYFVEYVRQQLSTRFGADLYRAGLRIYTTLDLDMQQAAERALSAQLEAIESGKYGPFPHKTYRQYLEARGDTPDGNRTTSPYLQGLMVTIEARTGAIRAMVGGRDFEDNKFNRAIQGLRQPGSTFKPFVYSAAIRAGIPLSRVIDDAPISLEIPGQDIWEPQNYDNKFLGPMTLRRALYQSRNTVAIRLGLEIGERAVISEATSFGITSSRIPAVPSIFIGSADVVPLEMIAAYIPFATLGVKTTLTAIQR